MINTLYVDRKQVGTYFGLCRESQKGPIERKDNFEFSVTEMSKLAQNDSCLLSDWYDEQVFFVSKGPFCNTLHLIDFHKKEENGWDYELNIPTYIQKYVSTLSNIISPENNTLFF